MWSSKSANELMPVSCVNETNYESTINKADTLLTHLVDSEGTTVAAKDLCGTTPGDVKNLNQSGHHLILLLSVTQAPITPKAPAEHTLLRVQNQLCTQTKTINTPILRNSAIYFLS